jgi:hypothetical protein
VWIGIEPPKIGEKHGQSKSDFAGTGRSDRGSGYAPVDGSPRVPAILAALATTLGLPQGADAAVAEAVATKKRPSVIWLHLECLGCTESILRAEHPTLEKLILDVISLDYHETLFAAAVPGRGGAQDGDGREQGSTSWLSRGRFQRVTAASTARSVARQPLSCSRNARPMRRQ